jgi:hypothetical protein
MKVDTRRVTIALVLTLVLLITLYFIVRYTINEQNRATVASLDETIVAQEKLLISLAEATRVNGADKATERIIVDCKADERQRFDKLLDQLSGTISKPELGELNTLFYKCGSFFADRKSVMATRLVREVEILGQFIDFRSVLTSETNDQSKKLEAWTKLAEAELKTAEYFNQLVLLQGKIITELNAGKSATSPELVSTLQEVNTVRGQMLFLSKQIEVFKTEALAI